jgi:deoxyribodipyrimidine photolyase-related protein
VNVSYIEASDPHSDIRNLIDELRRQSVKTIHIIDPIDDWLLKRISNSATQNGIEIRLYPTPHFLNTREDLTHFFKPEKKKFIQASFYSWQRKKYQILVDDFDKPVGGKWSFDADNRKKYPKNMKSPTVKFPTLNNYYTEAKKYVEDYFKNNLGDLKDYPVYPFDFESSREWLDDFLKQRFHEFGPYEDAIVSDQSILNHSLLSPLLNSGLITPKEVVDRIIEYAERYHVPINSTEGFIRQVIGWREFIRGMYEFRGSQERTTNFWGFTRKIPGSFYNASTGILPVDVTIDKVLKTGYCHHIERLMVIGNFMLLCEFDPDEVYQWFMEFFIDAYDWVMVPNVYGMSQFSDGGLMASKPYISGSNYLMKMSDYPKGKWQSVWDGLFWRFLHVHRDFFRGNPRLNMLLKTFDKMSEEKQDSLLNSARDFLKQMDGE